MDRWFDDDRHHEIRDHLNRYRKQMRALAEGRCPRDSRVLGAVYKLSDGYWLWHLNERMTPEQERHERLAMAAMEHETLVEHGTDPAKAWEIVLPDSDRIGDARGTGYSDRLVPLGDPLKTYQTTTGEQLRARLPGNSFATCGRCHLTYVIDYVVMEYAAGLAIDTRAPRAVVVHPGRVIPVDPEDTFDGPVFGIERSWRPTRWTIAGHDSGEAVT